ncbi:MAG: hypothetical protein KDA72_22925, partial [Planctomycetales bacterium]|nr:hypothetical protein [Planctomycetales bacterium]
MSLRYQFMRMIVTNYARVIFFLFAFMLIACSGPSVGLAQEVSNSAPDAGISAAELQRLAAEAASNRSNPPAPIPAELRGSNINILVLLRQGG